MVRLIIIYLLCIALVIALCACILGLAMVVGSQVPNLIHAKVSYASGVFLAKYGFIVAVVIPVIGFFLGLLTSGAPRTDTPLTLQPAE